MSTILLSIHPQYADAILSGDKTVEFRKMKSFSRKPTKAVIYSTAPVKKVVGEVEIQAISYMNPADLWDTYGQFGCISKQDFNSYYERTNIGCCLILGQYTKYSHPRVLNAKPPQSFSYIDDNFFVKDQQDDIETRD